MKLPPFVSLALFAAVAVAGGTAAPVSPSRMQTIAASDPRFRYEGRFDFADRAAPVVIWQGSRIALDFTGDQLAVRFEGRTDQNFFNVTVDGRTFVVAVPGGKTVRAEPPFPLAAGRHRLAIFKRTEAAAGTAIFRGVELAPGADAFAPPVPDYRVALMFVGDSITVGACNEDGATDQWDNRRTHNNALSWGAITADAFHADYRNIAVSGMGIVTGYVEPKAGEVWDRVYPEARSPRADLSAWTPSVVFVNYGENDDSFTHNQGQPFPSAAFMHGYVALIRAMRAAYPNAEIVCLRGGMFGGAKSEPLRAAWTAAVQELEAADAKVSHYVFTHWSETHPRVVDDRAMADELIAWLKAQPFFSAYR